MVGHYFTFGRQESSKVLLILTLLRKGKKEGTGNPYPLFLLYMIDEEERRVSNATVW